METAEHGQEALTQGDRAGIDVVSSPDEIVREAESVCEWPTTSYDGPATD